MACARKALAAGVCAVLACVLTGCNKDYETCDLVDIQNKLDKLKLGTQHCVDADFKSKDIFQECMCVSYRVWAADMKKYVKVCTKQFGSASVPPLDIEWKGSSSQTTCGMTLAASMASAVPIGATVLSDGQPMGGVTPREAAAGPPPAVQQTLNFSSSDGNVSASVAFGIPGGRPTRVQDEGAALGVKSPQAVAEPPPVAQQTLKFSSSDGAVAASVVLGIPGGLPTRAQDEEAALGALEKAMWMSIGACLMGAACLAARWRSGARDAKVSVAPAECEMSRTPVATA